MSQHTLTADSLYASELRRAPLLAACNPAQCLEEGSPGKHHELIASLGHALEARHLHRLTRQSLLDALACRSPQAAHLHRPVCGVLKQGVGEEGSAQVALSAAPAKCGVSAAAVCMHMTPHMCSCTC